LVDGDLVLDAGRGQPGLSPGVSERSSSCAPKYRAVHADPQTGRHDDQRIADEPSKAMTEAMASLHFGSLASAARVHRGREIRE
jgi:hypothetical protein